MVPMVLVWNFSPKRLEKLRVLCRRLGLACRPVYPAECGAPIAALPERASAAPGLAVMPFADEMLLMRGLDRRMIDQLLAGLKAFGLAPVPLKAVMTPTSAAWSAIQLHDELSREHLSFQKKA